MTFCESIKSNNMPMATKKSRAILRTRVAGTSEEIAEHFAIRKEIFVHEQQLFLDTDIDEYDTNAIPIICTVNGSIAGTVRVYRREGDTWFGGRLAVRKEFRAYMVGPSLVRKAVKTVKEHGCTTFLAHIQPQNVRFFTKLGWSRTGEEVEIKGVVHQVMKADLGRG